MRATAWACFCGTLLLLLACPALLPLPGWQAWACGLPFKQHGGKGMTWGDGMEKSLLRSPGELTGGISSHLPALPACLFLCLCPSHMNICLPTILTLTHQDMLLCMLAFTICPPTMCHSLPRLYVWRTSGRHSDLFAVCLLCAPLPCLSLAFAR